MTTSRAGAAPVTVDRAAIEHRLITLRKAVVQLDSLGRLDGARLANDPGTGLAVERVLALLNDLAFAINRHVSAGVLGAAPPRTPAASFGAAERAGLIDAELAAALAPADGPHHVLVQLYLDAEPEEVAAVVSAARSGYREYVRQVTGWITASAPDRVV
ncbi:HepT-like ribonuclease domain-containing protein [Streptomyces sp. NBC_00343]|uniref:HepT-like ribonuclease domain-containing protein n=1 Tax=Streptomyces sp. NBC_00343 TaxID=2975719 RepID=UPI002E2A9139|nr:HepT-like ribonuclease domain-containing protein [Streptomyces sp. NBC_00343]